MIPYDWLQFVLKDTKKKKIQRNREENAKRGWKMSYEGISHISCISILIGVTQTVYIPHIGAKYFFKVLVTSIYKILCELF